MVHTNMLSVRQNCFYRMQFWLKQNLLEFSPLPWSQGGKAQVKEKEEKTGFVILVAACGLEAARSCAVAERIVQDGWQEEADTGLHK